MYNSIIYIGYVSLNRTGPEMQICPIYSVFRLEELRWGGNKKKNTKKPQKKTPKKTQKKTQNKKQQEKNTRALKKKSNNKKPPKKELTLNT